MNGDWRPVGGGGPLTVGELRLYDAVRPGLPAGDYDVRVGTRLEPGTGGVAPPAQLPTTFAQTTTWTVRVDSPRFALLPSAVQRLAPAPGTADASPLELPHAVLRRATLPWERSAGSGLPWLAVVVLTDEELSRCALTVLPTAAAAGLTVRAVPDEGDPPETEVVGVPPALVSSVFPRGSDLALLCHGRETNPDDVALATGDDDGFFAVVIANRVPPAGTRCTALLVSLEARLDDITKIAAVVQPAPPAPNPAGPRPALGASDVVFPVLARWAFGTAAAGSDFMSVAGGLDTGLLGTQPGDPERAAAVAPTGHVALQARTRAGDPYETWYRGPATPFPVPYQALDAPAGHADALRATAPDSRLDVSYAAAFEIGRLLAVSDPAFVLALRRWARNGFRLSISFQITPWLPPHFDPNFLATVLPYAVPGLPVGRGAGLLGAFGPLLPSRGPLVIPGGGGIGPLVNPNPETLGGALQGFGIDLPNVIDIIRGGPVIGGPVIGGPVVVGPGGGPVIGGPGGGPVVGGPGFPGGPGVPGGPGLPGRGLRPGPGVTFDEAVAGIAADAEVLRTSFGELATRVTREIESVSTLQAEALRDRLSRRAEPGGGPGREPEGEWPP